MNQNVNYKTVITILITALCAVVIPMVLVLTLPQHTIENGIGYLFYESMLFGIYLIILTMMLFFYNPEKVYKKIKNIFPATKAIPFLFIKIVFYLVVFISFYLFITSILDIYLLY